MSSPSKTNVIDGDKNHMILEKCLSRMGWISLKKNNTKQQVELCLNIVKSHKAKNHTTNH